MHVTTGLLLWGAIGPLVGIGFGHVLTRQWQFKQWKLENRRQEYRELLQVLTSAYLQMVRFTNEYAMVGQLDAETIKLSGLTERGFALEQAKLESFRVLRDRIVIADELDLIGALDRWADAFVNFEANRNERLFADRFSELRESLVKMARNESPSNQSFSRRVSLRVQRIQIRRAARSQKS